MSSIAPVRRSSHRSTLCGKGGQLCSLTRSAWSCMVSLTMLNTINEQCNRIRALGRDSTAILGALPIVVFMGDFHQFAPVKAQPLWETPKNPRAALGQLIWHRFTDVIILDEQMRQATDPEFRALLRRARE